MNIFFDKTCNITSLWSSYDTNWEYIETTSIIYSWIACDFYKDTKNKFKQTDFSIQDKNYSYTVVLEWDKTNVDIWQIIELIDPNNWSYWTYIIDDILVYRNINWFIDNFELKVSEKSK